MATEPNQPMTPKEKEMMDAIIEIWDLLDKVPGCDAKVKITQIAGRIIYADN